MGHRWDCPTDYEARRQAEYDARQGYRNYSYGEGCREAEREYERQHRYAEQQVEEERMARRNAERRRQAQEYAEWEEQQAYEQQQQQAEYDAYVDQLYATAEAEYWEMRMREDFIELPRMADDGGPNHGT